MSKKVERGQATRLRIVATATTLFSELGYEATSIEAVLRESSVSRGALYHHFDSKDALFEAVLEAIEADLAQAAIAASRDIADPAKALRTGCDIFLDLTQTKKVRQIVLVDAPAVLGWQKWREIEARYGFGLLKAALEAAAARGQVRRDLVDVFAHMLLAALIEVALMVSRADDPAEALKSGRTALGELMDRLLTPATR
ncbi:MAG TPA: TetR/AcrR family transcriptional regulator [Reyranella sp.]